jgi:hypothetical protein
MSTITDKDRKIFSDLIKNFSNDFNDNFDKSAKNMLIEIAGAFERNLIDEVKNLNDEFSMLKR